MSNEVSGKAKGGKARAEKLSSASRKEIAQKAAEARWSNPDPSGKLPRVEYPGELQLGGKAIPCAVLDNQQRVITENGITLALLGSRSGASKRLKKAHESSGAPVPLFLAPSNLKPYIIEVLGDGPLLPIEYVHGNRIVKGYNASLLPSICNIWLKARQDGKLQDQQLEKAQQAEILMRGLAQVGIIALVDEATGYQDVRAKDELSKILEAYIAKELMPWTRRFPPEFYKEMFRIYGWQYNPFSVKRPGYVGKLTNKLVYEQLPPGVLEELKMKNPKNEKGRRKHKLFQFLTDDIGNPHLEKQIAVATMLMRISPSKNPKQFEDNFKRAFPGPDGYQESLFTEED